MADQDLYSGFIRLHILHHAKREAIFGLGIMRELQRHGYRVGPGTLYPILHSLERKGYLRVVADPSGSNTRRAYRTTSSGKRALAKAKEKVRELFGELIEDD